MVSVGIQPKIEHVFFNTIAQKFEPLIYVFAALSRKESKQQYMA